MSAIGERPRLAITLGDIAGIGPEVVVRALADTSVRDHCRPLVIGDPVVLERAARSAGLNCRVTPCLEPRWDEPDQNAIACWNPIDPVGDVPLGGDDPLRRTRGLRMGDRRRTTGP